jgi:broad specificity phosphatase PhoE
MATLYLVRHGETPWNVEGRYLGYPVSDLWSLLPVNGAWEVLTVNPPGDE